MREPYRHQPGPAESWGFMSMEQRRTSIDTLLDALSIQNGKVAELELRVVELQAENLALLTILGTPRVV